MPQKIGIGFYFTRPTLVLARQVEFLSLVVWTVLTILCLPRFLFFLIYACGSFWHATGDARNKYDGKYQS